MLFFFFLKIAYSVKLPVHLCLTFCFLSFLSCWSAIPGDFVLPTRSKGIHCHLCLLTRGVFFTALSRSHVSAQLFCFVITVVTRNNIVKCYLHERANPFLIYFGGVQGAGRRLSCSSLMPFSLLYQNAYKHFKCTLGISSREIKINN